MRCGVKKLCKGAAKDFPLAGKLSCERLLWCRITEPLSTRIREQRALLKGVAWDLRNILFNYKVTA